MKFKLGQKVRYKRISKKIEINMQYWTPDDFEEDPGTNELEEKVLIRRKPIELEKEKIGYIMGRRKLTFKTYFKVEIDNGDGFEDATEWVEIARQEYGYAYLIAYTMGKTDYVLEEDIIPTIYSNDDIYKIKGE